MHALRHAIFGLAVVVATGSAANAAILYSTDFDGGGSIASGVTSVFGPYTSDTAVVGPWNAAGWAGNIATNLTTGNPATFTTLSLSGIGAHTQISASFVLGLLDSWDSYDGNPAPDNLEIWIDGVQVGNLTANNAGGSTTDTDGGAIVAFHQQVNNNSFFYSDTLVDMTGVGYLTFAHTASTLTLGIRASGAGWQGGTDESWGIDNIKLTYDPTGGTTVPEPASWALMIAGFGLAGATLRRRRPALA